LHDPTFGLVQVLHPHYLYGSPPFWIDYMAPRPF
jgi:hypothetical protein